MEMMTWEEFDTPECFWKKMVEVAYLPEYLNDRRHEATRWADAELTRLREENEKTEGALCRARKVYDYYASKEKWRTAFIDKLCEILYSNPAPCPHAGELTALRASLSSTEKVVEAARIVADSIHDNECAAKEHDKATCMATCVLLNAALRAHGAGREGE